MKSNKPSDRKPCPIHGYVERNPGEPLVDTVPEAVKLQIAVEAGLTEAQARKALPNLVESCPILEPSEAQWLAAFKMVKRDIDAGILNAETMEYLPPTDAEVEDLLSALLGSIEPVGRSDN